jgi:hypothetical protein
MLGGRSEAGKAVVSAASAPAAPSAGHTPQITPMAELRTEKIALTMS